MNDSKIDPAEVSNFLSQREVFFETFFRKGAEFTAELLTELERLRSDTEALAEENLDLKHHLASDNAINNLLKKIEHLEEEKKKLKQHVQKAAAKSDDFAGRYEEMEKELDSMANLYVALYQLHATLSPQEVLGVIEQLLAQFIGAGSFVIYLQREVDGQKSLCPVHAYHCEGAAGTRIQWNDGPIGEAAMTKLHYVADLDSWKPGEPLACIPMVLGEETIGVIAIMGFFEQKERFVDIDFEFFKLLAIHSASAIVGSGLMARAGSIDFSLESYEHM
ncbi:MAG: GAF domain-containing protein [Proteobacteria bacterium]|nr:GAF domain-containing protein [Pseudomonadota bacterium]